MTEQKRNRPLTDYFSPPRAKIGQGTRLPLLVPGSITLHATWQLEETTKRRSKLVQQRLSLTFVWRPSCSVAGSRGGSIASMEPPFEGLPSPKYYMRKRATGATQLGWRYGISMRAPYAIISCFAASAA